MKRSIKWIAACVALLFVLAGCVADSSPGVRVVGDNVAILPAGSVMVVHKKNSTYSITYDGVSTVRFQCRQMLCPDMKATVSDDGVKTEVGTRALFVGSFYVWKVPDGAVNVEWPYGYRIQLQG